MTALTPRQTEVMHLIAQGYCEKEIAERLISRKTGLHVCEGTVSKLTQQIFERLNAKNRAHAVFLFYTTN